MNKGDMLTVSDDDPIGDFNTMVARSWEMLGTFNHYSQLCTSFSANTQEAAKRRMMVYHLMYPSTKHSMLNVDWPTFFAKVVFSHLPATLLFGQSVQLIGAEDMKFEGVPSSIEHKDERVFFRNFVLSTIDCIKDIDPTAVASWKIDKQTGDYESGARNMCMLICGFPIRRRIGRKGKVYFERPRNWYHAFVAIRPHPYGVRMGIIKKALNMRRDRLRNVHTKLHRRHPLTCEDVILVLDASAKDQAAVLESKKPLPVVDQSKQRPKLAFGDCDSVRYMAMSLLPPREPHDLVHNGDCEQTLCLRDVAMTASAFQAALKTSLVDKSLFLEEAFLDVHDMSSFLTNAPKCPFDMVVEEHELEIVPDGVPGMNKFTGHLIVIQNPVSILFQKELLMLLDHEPWLLDESNPDRRYRIAAPSCEELFTLGANNKVLPSVKFSTVDRLIIHLANSVMDLQKECLHRVSAGKKCFTSYGCNMVQYLAGSARKAAYDKHNDTGAFICLRDNNKMADVKARQGWPTQSMMQVVTLCLADGGVDRRMTSVVLNYYNNAGVILKSVRLKGCCMHVQTFGLQNGFHSVMANQQKGIRVVCSLRFTVLLRTQPSESLERMESLRWKIPVKSLRETLAVASRHAYVRRNCLSYISNPREYSELVEQVVEDNGSLDWRFGFLRPNKAGRHCGKLLADYLCSFGNLSAKSNVAVATGTTVGNESTTKSIRTTTCSTNSELVNWESTRPGDTAIHYPVWPSSKISCRGKLCDYLTSYEVCLLLLEKNVFPTVITPDGSKVPCCVHPKSGGGMIKPGTIMDAFEMSHLLGLGRSQRSTTTWNHKVSDGFLSCAFLNQNYKNDAISLQKVVDQIQGAKDHTKASTDKMPLFPGGFWIGGSGGAPILEGNLPPNDCSKVTGENNIRAWSAQSQDVSSSLNKALIHAATKRRVIQVAVMGGLDKDGLFYVQRQVAAENAEVLQDAKAMYLGLYFMEKLTLETDTLETIRREYPARTMSKTDEMFTLFRLETHIKVHCSPIPWPVQCRILENSGQLLALEVSNNLEASSVARMDIRGGSLTEMFRVHGTTESKVVESWRLVNKWFTDEIGKIEGGKSSRDNNLDDNNLDDSNEVGESVLQIGTDGNLLLKRQGSFDENDKDDKDEDDCSLAEDSETHGQKTRNIALSPLAFHQVNVSANIAGMLRFRGHSLYPKADSKEQKKPDNLDPSNFDPRQFRVGPLPQQFHSSIGCILSSMAMSMPCKSLDIPSMILVKCCWEMLECVKRKHCAAAVPSLRDRKRKQKAETWPNNYEGCCSTVKFAQNDSPNSLLVGYESTGMTACKVLEQCLFRALINRLLGNPRLYYQLEDRLRTTGTFIPGPDELEIFIVFLSSYEIGTNGKRKRNLSRFKSKQHDASIPSSLKEAVELAAFLRNVKLELPDLIEKMLTTPKTGGTPKDDRREMARISFAQCLSRCYGSQQQEWKMENIDFITCLVMRDLEFVFDKPFGELLKPHTSFGGKQAACLAEGAENSILQAIELLYQFTTSGKLTDVELACRGYYYKQSKDKKDPSRTVCHLMYKNKIYDRGDTEQELCKLAIVFLRTHPTRIGNRPRVQQDYAHPIAKNMRHFLPYEQMESAMSIVHKAFMELEKSNKLPLLPKECQFEHELNS